MRILFIGGMYRGMRLAQRLLERRETIVGAYIFEEDPHESPKHAAQIASLLTPHVECVRRTRRISAEQVADIKSLKPDVIFCLGWRTLLPKEALDCTPLGGIAVHDSLLPKLRGFAPTNWGMILGHDQLGATLFQLSDSVDAGSIYFQQAISPGPDECFLAIQDRIAEISVQLFDKFLDAACISSLTPFAQDHSQATYTCARIPADGEIDWQKSSGSIERIVRALAPPAPGAFTYLRGESLTITDASAVENPLAYEGRIPGRIVDRDMAAGTVDVLCGEGVLRIGRVMRADGKETAAALIMRSVRASLGLNHSQEIVELRQRVARLELILAEHQQQHQPKMAG